MKAIFPHLSTNREYINVVMYYANNLFVPGVLARRIVPICANHLGDRSVLFNMYSDSSDRRWKSTLTRLAADEHKHADKLWTERDIATIVSPNGNDDDVNFDYYCALRFNKLYNPDKPDAIRSVATLSVRVDADTAGGITKLIDEYVAALCAVQGWVYGFAQPMFLSDFGRYSGFDDIGGVMSMKAGAEERRWWASRTDRSIQVRGLYWGNIWNHRTVAHLCSNNDFIGKWSAFSITNAAGRKTKGRQRVFRLDNGGVYLTLTDSVRESSVSYQNSINDSYTLLYDEMAQVLQRESLFP